MWPRSGGKKRRGSFGEARFSYLWRDPEAKLDLVRPSSSRILGKRTSVEY
jgi:hypothetical protein